MQSSWLDVSRWARRSEKQGDGNQVAQNGEAPGKYGCNGVAPQRTRNSTHPKRNHDADRDIAQTERVTITFR